MLDKLSRRASGSRSHSRAELRFGISLVALSLAISGTMLLPQRAEAGCSVTGNVGTPITCDATNGVGVYAISGPVTLTIDGINIANNTVTLQPAGTTGGPFDLTLTMRNTTVNATTYGALNMASGAADTNVNVTLESTTSLTTNAGFGGVWVRNDVSGNITVNSAATIDTTNVFGMDLTTHAGAVTVTNSGSVTAHTARGIYADGNYAGTTAQTVSVTNTSTGLVSSYLAGIRVIDYFGLAEAINQGTVNATVLQAVVAWSANGDASINNSGTATSGNDNAVYAATETGKATVINSGTVTAYGNPALDAAHVAISTPAGYSGLRATVDTSGDVEITNTGTGIVTASRDSGILAQTPTGTVTVNNFGQVTGATGIVVNSGLGATNATVSTVNGTATITNSGTVTATSYAVSIDATSNVINNTGTITTTGTTAVQTGNGNSTIVNSGRIAAASASDTAIAMGSGSNRLVLADTATLVGKVTNVSISNMLELTGSATGTLDLGSVGAGGTYQGFANLTKSGTGQWTLTGSGSTLTGTAAIDAGTLVLTGALGVSTMTIGNTAQATLNVNSGGSLTSSHATIGTNAGGDGRVTVSGAGSTWTSTGNIYVGNGGNGSLTIDSGAVVSAVDGYVSTLTGSTSSLTVTGTASALNLSGVFIAGYSSGTNATVALSNGGQISGMQGTLGDLAGSSGTMTISGSGSKWSAFVNAVTYSGYMNVGRLGSGSLTVTDGGSVTGYRLYIGNEVGSTGTVTLSGSGSLIQMTSNLYVGSEGTGTLTLSDGAQISAAAVKIGYLAGAVGTLNVGAAAGQAAAAAGIIDATEIVLGAGDSRLVLNHTASNYGIGANITGTGQLIVLNGTTNLTGSNTYTGETLVSAGALVFNGGTSSIGVITVGRDAGTTGALTVTGAGTTLTTGANTVTIGTNGTGSLSIGSGAQLTSNALILGEQAGATGTATVSGTNSSLTSSTYLKVGNLGTGSLTLNSGATATVGQVTYIGDFDNNASPTASGSGSLSLTGSGTQFTTQGLYLRNIGAQTSSLRIEDGAVLDNLLGLYMAGDNSTIYVNGANSALKVGTRTSDPVTWSTTDGWFSADKGQVEVSGGALLDADGSYIGGVNTATMLVTGTGTRWLNGLPLYIGGDGNGNQGNGTVTVSGGAYVKSSTSAVGVDAGAVGKLTLSGAGTIYEVVPNAAAGALGNMRVGFSGTGTVTVSDGALLRAANQINIATNAGSAGVLSIGGDDGAAAAAPGTLDGGTLGIVFGDGSGKLVFNHTGTAYVFDQTISGTGEVVQQGPGTTILTGNSSAFTGSTTISAGTLQIGNGGTTGSLAGNIADNGALVFNRSDALTYAGIVSGTGSLTQAGTGTLTLTGANSYTGGTTISSGTLVGSTSSLTGNIVNNAALTFDQASTGTFAGAISGAGALTKTGAGTLTLTGTNTYTGGTTISAGTLVGSTRTLTGDIVNNAALTFDQSGDGTFSGTVSGTGTLTKSGDGILLLTGSNSYTGGTTVSAGALRIGDGGTTGSIVGDVVNNGRLLFNRSDAVTFGGSISGTGSVRQNGPGILTLTGTNTYTGGTEVFTGGLVIAGSVAGDVQVIRVATLSGSGSIAGAVIMSSSSTLAGTQSAPLTMGSLSLSSNVTVNVTLGAPSASAAFIVQGNLTLDGTLNVTQSTGFGTGVYRIFNYGGTLTDNGLNVSGVGGLAGNVQTAVAGQVNLLVSDPGQTMLFWNGTTITPTGTVVGGAGTWTAGTQANWTDASGTVPQAWNGSFAVFQGTAGTVTVDTGAGAVSTTGMQFVTGGYVVTGGDLTLSGTARATFRVGDGTSGGAGTVATIASALTGTGGIDKTDLGTLILTGANTYTGGTTISAGTLVGNATSLTGMILNNAALTFDQAAAGTYAGAISGSGSVIKIGAGTLTLSGANTYTGGTTISAGAVVGAAASLTGNILNNAALTFDQAAAGTYAGAISGSGSVTKIGAGTLTLTGTNSYSGGTTISAGLLQIGDGGTSGALTGDVVNNAGIAFNRSDAMSFAGTISGTGSLFKSGTGTLTLSGTNTYTGLTTVQGGGLAVTGSLSGDVSVASGATLSGSGSVAGNVSVNGGTLAGTQATPFTLGSLTLASASNVNVTLGTPSASPPFTVLGNLTLDGTLNVTADSGFGTGVYRIFNYGGVLTDNGLDVSAVSGLVGNVQTAVAGQVNLLVSDPGQTILFWNGTTITPTGTIVGGNGTWTSGTQTNWTDASGTVPQAWSSGFAVFQGSAGTVTVDTGAGAVATTGMQFLTSGYVVSGGDLTLAGSTQATIRVGDGTSAGASSVATIASALTGSGGLNKTDLGTLILTGASTYTGGTTITAGTLQIGDGGTIGSIAGSITNNGALVFNRSDAVSFTGVISGTGSLAQNGSGTVTLGGNNTYSGGTSITAGTLQVSSASAFGTGSLALSGTGTLRTSATFTAANGVTLTPSGGTSGTGGGSFNVDANTALTLSGAIGGTGALTKVGTGTLILTGTNTYSGGTTISAGTLQIGNGGTSGSITGNVVNNGTLVFNRSDTYAFTGAITGSGAVTFMGGGTVAFSSPYTGPVAVDNTFTQLQAGTVTTSPFTVNTGGVLGGTATIGGLTVNAGGTAAPGYSPGTLTVSGAVAFNAGSIYAVDVTPAGAHDLIIATGAVTISSGASVQVAAVPGKYASQSTIPIITTSGTVSGTFGSVTSDYAFLAPQLSYDAQNVYLTLTYSGMKFIDYARTPNEANVALAAQALGSGNPVFEAIFALPQSAVAPAFDQLSGEIYPSINTVIQQQSIYLREAVGARLRQSEANGNGTAGALSSAAKIAGPARARLSQDLTPTLWMQGYGGWGNSFGTANAASISNTIGGFFGGVDVGVMDNVRVGLVGGFSQSQFDVNARNSSGTMDNYDVGLYGGGQWGAFAVRGGLSYTWHDISAGRSVVFSGFNGSNSSGYSLGTTQLFGEVGYDMQMGSYAFEPFLGLAYLNVSGGSFTESGVGGSALSVGTGAQNTLYSTLGLRAATSLTLNGHTLTPSVTLGWQHAFGDTTSIASMQFLGGTTPFQVSGVPIAQDAAVLGAGIAYDLSDLAKLQFTYSGQIAGQASQNAFSTQFSLKF